MTAHYNLALIYEALGDAKQATLHRQLHERYRPDDNATDRAISIARRANKAADHAAQAIVIYPLQRPGAPGLSSQPSLSETVQVVGQASRSVPLGFGPHPEGISDNSPTFQRWVREFRSAQVPKGRLKQSEQSTVPTGLVLIPQTVPNIETLGYYRTSLRDNDFAWPRNALLGANPCGIGRIDLGTNNASKMAGAPVGTPAPHF